MEKRRRMRMMVPIKRAIMRMQPRSRSSTTKNWKGNAPNKLSSSRRSSKRMNTLSPKRRRPSSPKRGRMETNTSARS